MQKLASLRMLESFSFRMIVVEANDEGAKKW